MSRLEANEVWRIDPDPGRARAVKVTEDAAILHVPQVLTVGSAASPERYPIRVSALDAPTPAGRWIAALFTTNEKRRKAGP